MSQVTDEKAEWNPTNAEYHSQYHEWVSHSSLEVFRRSVVEYAARFVFGTMKPPEPTPAMALGSALHAIILEADRFDEIVAVAPDVDRRKKDGKLIWEAFQQQCNGIRTIITSEQYDIVVKMAKSVLAHPEASKLMQRAEYREKAFQWVNEQTGLRCKCKPDLLWLSGGVIGDLKTSSTPCPNDWFRQAGSLGYHRQGAHYIDGITAVADKPIQMCHIVVGTSEPYECGCFYFGPASIDAGRFQNQSSLTSLASCIASGDWTATQNRLILTGDVPRWCMD